jgi:hypothetical protein
MDLITSEMRGRKRRKKSRRRGKEEGNWAERGKTREKEREWQRTSGKLSDQRVTYVQSGITVRIPIVLT